MYIVLLMTNLTKYTYFYTNKHYLKFPMKRIAVFLALAVLAVSCGEKKQPALIDPDAFADTLQGRPVALYTLRGGDVVLQATNYGARVVSIFTPDRKGNYEDIVVGRPSLDAYVHCTGERFLGACVGPVANRIAKARFTVGDTEYILPANDHDKNTLHGGFTGVDNLVWDVAEVTGNSLTLTLLHEDGQEGFPGNLSITMKYEVTPDNSFKITYSAVTDKATPVNITNHPFFCLRGEGNGTIDDYLLTIPAGNIVPVDDEGIPTGGLMPVDGTPFDFREPVRIGERIDADDVQLKNVGGYDHNWCIDGWTPGEVKPVCTVSDPETGRTVEVLSDQPGLQFYSGNFFDGTDTGKNGNPLGFRSSLALETQHYPDSPNNPDFPSILLNPGETYTHTCIYRFSAK